MVSLPYKRKLRRREIQSHIARVTQLSICPQSPCLFQTTQLLTKIVSEVKVETPPPPAFLMVAGRRRWFLLLERPIREPSWKRWHLELDSEGWEEGQRETQEQAFQVAGTAGAREAWFARAGEGGGEDARGLGPPALYPATAFPAASVEEKS